MQEMQGLLRDSEIVWLGKHLVFLCMLRDQGLNSLHIKYTYFKHKEQWECWFLIWPTLWNVPRLPSRLCLIWYRWRRTYFYEQESDLLHPGFLPHLLTGQLAHVLSTDLSPWEEWNDMFYIPALQWWWGKQGIDFPYKRVGVIVHSVNIGTLRLKR